MDKGFNFIALGMDITIKAGVSVKLTRSFDEAVSAAHFISIHLPLLESTRGLIGSEKLALMHKGSFLINTSRGGIVLLLCYSISC